MEHAVYHILLPYVGAPVALVGFVVAAWFFKQSEK